MVGVSEVSLAARFVKGEDGRKYGEEYLEGGDAKDEEDEKEGGEEE